MRFSRNPPAELSPIRRSTVFLLAHLALLLVVGIGYHPEAVPIDDAYITFRYAENLAAGHGLIYNRGEAFLGTSTPGYAILLALVRRTTGLEIVQAAVLLHFGALLVLAVAVWRLFRDRPLAVLALLVPYALVASPLARLSVGMESLCFVALAMVSIGLALARRLLAWGLVGGLLCLIRPDGAILFAVLLGFLWWEDRRVPWRALIGGLAIGVPWVVFATASYGSPLPATVAAKALQARSGLWTDTYLTYWWRELALRPEHGWWLLTIPAAGVAIWRRDRLGRIVAAWMVVHNVAFAVAAVPPALWYYVPPLAQGAVLTAAMLARIPAGRKRWNGLRAGPVAAGVAVTAAALVLLLVRPHALADPRVRFRAANLAPVRSGYFHIGRWLAENTPPQASVGTVEVGMLGYYSGRTMHDALGLVTPGVAERVPDRSHVDYLMRRYRPDYFVAGQPLHGHDSDLMQYLDRGYDVRLNLGDRLVLERKAWDEAWLAERAASPVRESGARSVYFADFPWLLDFERFAERMAVEAPGVRFSRDFRAPHDQVLQLAQDGRMRTVPFRPETAERFPAGALAGWRRVGLAPPEPSGRGVRFVTRSAYAHLVGEIERPGPFRRFRLRLRLVDAGDRRRGGEGRLVCTTRREGSANRFQLVFTMACTADATDVVVRIPGPGIASDEVLSSLKMELLDRPGVVILEQMVLERQ